MRRDALAALILAVTLAGCGSATSSTAASSSPAGPVTGRARDPRLTVMPRRGGPETRFIARFVAPASSGTAAGTRLGFTLSLNGGRGTSCIGARSVPVPPAVKGVPLSIALAPAQLGGAWCSGPHTARVTEVETPVCNPGTMCPQFVRVVGIVGEARFTVTGHGG